MTTPRTAAGRALNDKYLTGADDYAPFTDDILAIEAEARAAALEPVFVIVNEPCPFCGDATTLGCPESSHSVRNRLRDALRERSGE